MVKEFFEKHKKKIYIGLLIVLCISNVVTGCSLERYVTTARRANYETAIIREQLERERATVELCRNSVGVIADGLSSDITELGDIINCLQRISKEVENMENYLYSNSGNISSWNNNDDNNL